ncbi:uncharacterized protein LOC132714094 [Ruditapes philippinarum]|uniref:uncharacterized protein LOC132714094 n=1 Tax=Ruditapes philippinarum TaxID=129788 RepID=UPI00295AC839|nr:uncharacterized protein LOC132714094 [Ruditapes philippinarum]
MEFGRSVFLVTVVACVVFQEVTSLMCYSCSNAEEPKCGKTWELSDKEAEKYVVNCTGYQAACKKIDTTDSNKGQLLVTRSCWSVSIGTDVEMNSNFLDCTDIANLGTACYCKEADDKPCNGKQATLTYISLVMAVFSVFCNLIL